MRKIFSTSCAALCLLTATIALAACNTYPGAPAVTLPDGLTQIVSANRAAVFQLAGPDVMAAVKSYQLADPDQHTDAQTAQQVDNTRDAAGAASPYTLRRDLAGYELDYLFDLLKYGYGGYTYFGGRRFRRYQAVHAGRAGGDARPGERQRLYE